MFQKIRRLIEENDSIVIVSHFNPDGDAYGSQIGLRDSLRETFKNKKIYAIGSGLENFKSLFGDMDIVSDDIIEQSLIILLDANELNRFEDPRCLKGKDFVLIDHHIQNVKFDFECVFVEVGASSTCELVALFLKESNYIFSKSAATALLLGLITDSGRFQYSNNYKRTFEISSYLIEMGADIKNIYNVLNLVSSNDLKIKQFVFENLKFEKNLIYVSFTKKDLDKLGVSTSYALSFINQIGNMENYPIWMMLAEEKNNSVHFEFRSSKYIIQPIARKYGGGGHANAAGVTITNYSEEIKNQIIHELIDLTEDK